MLNKLRRGSGRYESRDKVVMVQAKLHDCLKCAESTDDRQTGNSYTRDEKITRLVGSVGSGKWNIDTVDVSEPYRLDRAHTDF